MRQIDAAEDHPGKNSTIYQPNEVDRGSTGSIWPKLHKGPFAKMTS